jgi:hypothetical protein
LIKGSLQIGKERIQMLPREMVSDREVDEPRLWNAGEVLCTLSLKEAFCVLVLDINPSCHLLNP